MTDRDAFAVRVGRFGANLYSAIGVALLGWAVIAGEFWQPATAGFACLAFGSAAFVHVLPWRRHGELLLRVLVLGSSVSFGINLLLYPDDVTVLVLPAIGAAYSGAVVGWRWLLAQQVIPAVLFGVQATGTRTLREAVAVAFLLYAYWVMTGAVGAWMRSQVEAVGRDLLAQQAAEAERSAIEAAEREEAARVREADLEERVELASSLRGGVEAVTVASRTVEQQASDIAAAVEQLAGSLRETSATSSRTSRTVEEMARAGEEGRALIERLGDAGDRISGIVETIAGLSGQTNLLALNATIEAERAGEAGRGFAVVAQEVKKLANRTSASAAEITEVVGLVQESVRASVDAMGGIADLVAAVNDDQGELGRAVELQSQVVDQIAGAAGDGAAGVASIGDAIRDLDRDARRLSGAAGQAADR